MAKFKVGDKAMLDGNEVELCVHDAVRDWWLVTHLRINHAMDCCPSSRLSPVAPPKLGKVRMVIYPNGEAGAWSEQESAYVASTWSLTPGKLKCDRILDLDALDADAKRVKELEAVCESWRQDNARLRARLAAPAAKPGAGRYRWAKYISSDGKKVALYRDGHPWFSGVLDGFTRTEYLGDEHGVPVSDEGLISMDELRGKYSIFIHPHADGWMISGIGGVGHDQFPTHAAAHRAASDYARGNK